MNWIRPATRVAIYLRDGLACAYCTKTIDDGAELTLDHCTPRSKDGGNEVTNLLTVCHRCNSTRGDMPMAKFAALISKTLRGEGYRLSKRSIMQHVSRCRKRQLDKRAARLIIKNRNSTIQELLTSN
jgi:5-methylcytosine-specific restriction endonuclease McrA